MHGNETCSMHGNGTCSMHGNGQRGLTSHEVLRGRLHLSTATPFRLSETFFFFGFMSNGFLCPLFSESVRLSAAETMGRGSIEDAPSAVVYGAVQSRDIEVQLYLPLHAL